MSFLKRQVMCITRQLFAYSVEGKTTKLWVNHIITFPSFESENNTTARPYYIILYIDTLALYMFEN